MPISSNISLMLLFLHNIPLCVQRAKILSRRTWEAFESPDFKLHTQEVLMWKDSLGPQVLLIFKLPLEILKGLPGISTGTKFSIFGHKVTLGYF